VTSSWFFLSTLNYDARSTTHQIQYFFGRQGNIINSETWTKILNIKVMVTPELDTKGQRGSRDRAFLINLGLRWGGCSTPRPGHCTPEKGTRHPLHRRLSGPRASLCGSIKSRPTGIRSPDFLARSELLYRLSYPDPDIRHILGKYGVNLGTTREWRAFVSRPAGNVWSY